MTVTELEAVPGRLLHRHPGREPASSSWGQRALSTRRRRVLRPGRQQPGLQRLPVLGRQPGGAAVDVPGQAVPGPPAGAGRGARGLRSIGLLGSRSEENPVHSLILERDSRGSSLAGVRNVISTRPVALPAARIVRGKADDGTDRRHRASCRSPEEDRDRGRDPAQGKPSRHGRGDRRGLHSGPGRPRLRGPGLRDSHGLDGPHTHGSAQGADLPPVRVRLHRQRLSRGGGRFPGAGLLGNLHQLQVPGARAHRGPQLQGRSDPGHDVPVRPSLPSRGVGAAAVGCRRLSLSRGAGGQLHQAPDRPSGRDHPHQARRHLHQAPGQPGLPARAETAQAPAGNADDRP